jgi:hypothetical protein
VLTKHSVSVIGCSVSARRVCLITQRFVRGIYCALSSCSTHPPSHFRADKPRWYHQVSPRNIYVDRRRSDMPFLDNAFPTPTNHASANWIHNQRDSSIFNHTPFCQHFKVLVAYCASARVPRAYATEDLTSRLPPDTSGTKLYFWLSELLLVP